MTLDEVCRWFGKSRRTIMRLIDAGKLPDPIDRNPMSFDGRAIRSAGKVLREEHDNERKHRNGRKDRSKRSRRGSRPRR